MGSARRGFHGRHGLEAAFGLDKGDDEVQAFAFFEIGHDERPCAAHPACVGVHFFQRSADMGRQIDLVDDKQIGSGDAGTALGRDFIAGGDVDDIDREIGELR
jgi:hypothetical protein